MIVLITIDFPWGKVSVSRDSVPSCTCWDSPAAKGARKRSSAGSAGHFSTQTLGRDVEDGAVSCEWIKQCEAPLTLCLLDY